MSKYNFVIPQNLNNHRIDKALASMSEAISRSQIQKAIKNKDAAINGEIIWSSSRLTTEGDVVDIIIADEKQESIVATNILLDIIYEDDDLLVINKPNGMTVHPGAGNYKDTLVNALLHRAGSLSDIGGEMRPGIVHRLDKDTSGLMLVAKNNKAHLALASQIESRILKRKYSALVWGMLRPQEGMIKNQMARSSLDRKKMTTVKSGGRIAITYYKTIEIFKSGMFSLVQCQLDTGRTHQIRVHMSHNGHSVVGDQVYGNNKRKIDGCEPHLQDELRKFNRQALHSFYISFLHPTSGISMEFEQAEPTDYINLLKFLRDA